MDSGLVSGGGEPGLRRLKLLLTVEEAAEALSLGRTFVYSLVMAGQIVSVKVGRKRRIPVAALEAFVAEQVATMRKGA